MTTAELRKGSRIGCAVCYDTFKTEIARIITGMQKGAQHSGKVPVGSEGNGQEGPRISGLRKDLEKAVAAEDYENAARLRDEILNERAKNEGTPGT